MAREGDEQGARKNSSSSSSSRKRYPSANQDWLSGCWWLTNAVRRQVSTCWQLAGTDMHVLLWLQTAFKCVIGLIIVAFLGSKGLLVRQPLHQQVCCSAVDLQQAYGQASTAGLQHLMNVYLYTLGELSWPLQEPSASL